MKEDREKRWQALMCKAQQGDKPSYHDLLEELEPFIGGYCRKFTSDPEELREYTQDCLLAVHRARISYDGNRAFLPWLVTVVRHRAIDRLRKRAKELEREVLREDVAEVFQSNRSVQAMEGAIVLEKLLDSLGDKYRNPIILTKLEGLTEKEVAKKLDLTESTVKIRVHRGMKHLRKSLRKEISEIEKKCRIGTL